VPTLPYGTWPSPITPALVASQGLRLGAVSADGDDVYWTEGRALEGGRTVLVRRRADGLIEDVTPAPFNVRTRVHEYGGGAYVVSRGVAYFSNFADQRIYRIDIGGSDGVSGFSRNRRDAPSAVTAEGPWFYADAAIDARRRRLVCVREDHADAPREPMNALVSIPLDGPPGAGQVIASGDDFYSTPRLSPDGSRLAWISWRHPRMPWDGTELWVADVAADGALTNRRLVAGGESESIYQPGWSPGGELYFVSDRDGWWRLYRSGGQGARGQGREDVRPVLDEPPPDTEFGQPQWIFGTSTWAFAGPSRMVVSWTRRGQWRLGVIDVDAGTLQVLPAELAPHDWLVATPTHAVTVAGTSSSPDAVVRIGLASGSVETLRRSSSHDVPPGSVSVPEPIEFPTGDGLTAHAFYYPPRLEGCEAPAGERPPLIVVSHGGPTTATSATFDLKLQYWTSRGFAVVDVNYGGSSGYGRGYRRRLNGQWGIVDVDDCVNAARYLASAGKADPRRLVIRGGSAGGYTTLAALTFHPGVFAAGASYYGISDIEVLARDTHKFESRYLDTLVGPYPAAADVYKARSPIHFVDDLACPLILFQGLEDKVVPPNQSQMMADAVRAKGLRVEYLTFEGEQHGFRKAETIIRCLEAELAFYLEVLNVRAA
jgi:dipeptidyl aminopeptidase/acylaminoacyl peptidase